MTREQWELLKEMGPYTLSEDGILHNAEGVSMAFSEGLSDTGELTGRGNPIVRGGITGLGTFVGGILHSLPFLIPSFHAALITAFAVVACELVALAFARSRFFSTGFVASLAAVSLAGAIIVAISAALGATV